MRKKKKVTVTILQQQLMKFTQRWEKKHNKIEYCEIEKIEDITH